MVGSGPPIHQYMSIRTGFCAAGVHEQCLVVAVNGTRAHDRYVLCSCSCHDGSVPSQELLMMRAPGPIAAPVKATAAEFQRYVDTLNAILRPKDGSRSDDHDEALVGSDDNAE